MDERTEIARSVFRELVQEIGSDEQYQLKRAFLMVQEGKLVRSCRNRDFVPEILARRGLRGRENWYGTAETGFLYQKFWPAEAWEGAGIGTELRKPDFCEVYPEWWS